VVYGELTGVLFIVFYVGYWKKIFYGES